MATKLVEGIPEGATRDVKYWLKQIDAAKRRHHTWWDRGEKVEKRYLKADIEEAHIVTKAPHVMNVLWSNVQTISPALYAKPAEPAVQRRFRDKDPVGKWGAEVLERAEKYELDAYDDDQVYRSCILDYLLPGRGQLWVYYEPEFDATGKKLVFECCKLRYIHWKDFLTSYARTWDEVARDGWVGKREKLTKEQAKAQKLNVDQLTFNDNRDKDSPKIDGTPDEQVAEVWEIWDKKSGKIFFVSQGSPVLLRPAEPPKINFEGFFPCPRPLNATTTNDSIIPVPDFLEYQDLADEIDRLTQRINLLTKALRIRGVYDSTQGSLQHLMDDQASDNDMFPVDQWAVFAQQGGLKGSIDFVPLDMIVQALEEAIKAREAVKASMYEITGISDIVRGASNPDETATAQQIKSQWGGLRIRDRQREVQRFIRDTMRLKAEIYAGVFQPDTLKTMTNVPLLTQQEKAQIQQRQQAQQQAQQMAQQAQQQGATPEQMQQFVQSNPQIQQLLQPIPLDQLQMMKEPSWEDVAALLKDQKLRGYHIDIETDSTIAADENEDKQSRVEFLTAMTQFLTGWGPMVLQYPPLGPLMAESMKFAARGFKAASSLESAIEEFGDQLEQQRAVPQAQQQPPPDPKAEAEAKKQQFEAAQAEKQQAFEQQKMSHEQQLAGQQMQMKQQDAQLQQQQLQAKQQDAQAQRDHEFRMAQVNAQKDTAVAEASQPKIDGKAATEAFAPVLQAIHQDIAGSLEQQMELFKQALAQFARIAAAPRKIAIQRDQHGRVIGGSAQPDMGTMQ